MAGRNIKGITVQIGGDTTKLQTALEGVNSKIKNTQAQLKDVEKLLKLDPGNTELLAQKHKLLAEAVSETKSRLETLETAAKQANDALAKGEISQEQYDALQREIVETKEELERLETAANQSATAVQKIAAEGEKLKNIGDNISGVGEKFLPATAAVVGLGTAAVKTAADFDTGMSKVAAISGATGDDLDALRAKAREMGAKTKFSASEAASAMEYMAMAGWKTEDMLGGIEGIMNLAAASGEDLATTSDIVTDALTAFGMSAQESGHFADILAAASSNANTNVSMMGETFKYAAPVAGALGYTAEDTALAIGMMANAGIKSSQAGTAIRSGLTRLVKPTKQVREAMDKYGISITDGNGKMYTLREMMLQLRQKLGGLSEAEQGAAAAAIFGTNAMSGWLAVINGSEADMNKLAGAIDTCSYNIDEISDAVEASGVKWGKYADKAWMATGNGIQGLTDEIIYNLTKVGTSAEDLQDYLVGEYDMDVEDAIAAIETVQKSLENTTGVSEQMAETMQDNLEGQLTILKSQLEELAISFGEILMPVIRDIVSGIQGLVDKLNNMSPATKALIAKIALVVAAIGPVLIVIGKVVSAVGTIMTIVPKVAGAIQTIKGGLAGLHAVMAANPIGIVIAAIAALVAAFIYLWNNCEEFREFWINLWEKVKDVAVKVWNGIKTFVTNAWNAIKTTAETVFNAISGFFSGIWQGISTTATNAWNGITEGLSNAWEGIKGTAETVWGAISGTVSTITDGISSAVQDKWSNMQAAYEQHSGGLKGIAAATMEGVKGFFTLGFDAINNITGGKLNGIKTAVSTACTNIKTSVTTAWNNIKTGVSTTLTNIKSGVSTAWTNIKSNVTSTMQGLGTSIKSVWSNIQSGISNTISNIVTSIQNGFNNAVNFVKNLASQAWNWGADLVNGIVNGIKSAMHSLTSAVSDIAAKIKSFLHFSVPDEGPLTDYESWMPDFIGGLAQGIERSRGMIQNAMKGLAGDMVLTPALAGAGAGGAAANTGAADLIAAMRESLSNANSQAAGDITIPVYIGNERIEEIVVKANKAASYRSGGR